MGNIGSAPNSAGKSKAGSSGNVGSSTKMNPCASNAGAAKVRGGATACGNTGKQGPQPNVSGSKGSG